MAKQKPMCYTCVYATQYENALSTEINTALVYWEMKQSSKKESVYLLQILKALCTGALSGLSEFRKLSEYTRSTVSESKTLGGESQLLSIGQLQ